MKRLLRTAPPRFWRGPQKGAPAFPGGTAQNPFLSFLFEARKNNTREKTIPFPSPARLFVRTHHGNILPVSGV